MKRFLAATTLALGIGLPMAAAAQQIQITDAFARSSTAVSASGAAFMVIENHGSAEDRLISAASDVAARVELHTHREDAGGVMRMIEVEEGFSIPAGGRHELARGGDHVMFMGLTRALEQGETVTLTLTFEQAGEVVVEVPVDLERRPQHGGHMMQHGHGIGHGQKTGN